MGRLINASGAKYTRFRQRSTLHGKSFVKNRFVFLYTLGLSNFLDNAKEI